MIASTKQHGSLSAKWQTLPGLFKAMSGIAGSLIVLWAFWQTVLLNLNWPPIGLVGSYFWDSMWSLETYQAILMTGFRALLATCIGFILALVLAILTGRTVLGWCAFFFLLLILQKIPAIAMVHVFVKSKLGIGFVMTIALASTVVMTFTWLILHHRARTLDPREVFALRVVGFRGWQLGLFGLLPHMGSAIGAAARLAMSIAVIMVVMGEWQGVWEDDSIWQYGLGVRISRDYDAINSTARVLASCFWLGLLGLTMDGIVQGALRLSRFFTGVDLKR